MPVEEKVETGPPIVLHVINHLIVGGLENGLVNLINHTPPERYRHGVICLTHYNDFRYRIRRADVPVIPLYKREGHDLGIYRRLWKVLRRLRPAIVHTRNLSGLEYLIPATLAGVPGRIHGEHGRDIYDLGGSNFKYNLLRKAMQPFVHRYIAVSSDLAQWLTETVGISRERVTQVYNGVDLNRFYPRNGYEPPLWPEGFAPLGTFVIGTVGRMQVVKVSLTLVQAFLHLLNTIPHARSRLRLVMVGDGPLRQEALQLLREASATSLAWLPGECADIPRIMRTLDLFVLPSIAEGISNTILEAMATGLPVVATRVGGNPELVEEAQTGTLVPSDSPAAMAEAIEAYLNDKAKLVRHGQSGRRRVQAQFAIEAMVNGYLSVYDSVLAGRSVA